MSSPFAPDTYEFDGLPSGAPLNPSNVSSKACAFGHLYSFQGDRVLNEIFRNNQIDEILQFSTFYGSQGGKSIQGNWAYGQHLRTCASWLQEQLRMTGGEAFFEVFTDEDRQNAINACLTVMAGVDKKQPLHPGHVLKIGMMLVQVVSEVFDAQLDLKDNRYQELTNTYVGMRGEQWLVQGKEFNSIIDLAESRRGSKPGFLSLTTNFGTARDFATTISKKNMRGTPYFIRYYITNDEKHKIVSVPMEHCTETTGESEILLFPNYTVHYIANTAKPFRVVYDSTRGMGNVHDWSHFHNNRVETAMMLDIALDFQTRDQFQARCKKMIKEANEQLKKYRRGEIKFVEDESQRGYKVSEDGEYVAKTTTDADPEIKVVSKKQKTGYTMDEVIEMVSDKIKKTPAQAEMMSASFDSSEELPLPPPPQLF